MTDQAFVDVLDFRASGLAEHIQQQGLPFIRGIEKEGLRVDADGAITQSDHPKALGHALTHESITTDYSEALLELITGISTERDALLAELHGVHHFVQNNLGEQNFWPASMPCKLDGNDSIRIAEYGDSNVGQLKHVYRQGLDVRYGRVMQSIAGLHFNFSLNDGFWQALQEAAKDKSELSAQDFNSEAYFALIRNFRRHSWALMYLFGASPALDQSFVGGNGDHGLQPFDDKGTLYKEYACSLRMGDLGYHNNAQADLNICFNTLDNFTSTLGAAVKTPYAKYQEIGLKRGEQYIQLNSNILQIENEYYSSIRPKRTALDGEKPTQALAARGVEYIEVRCLDLNPFEALGINATQIDFMDLFLLHCLLSPSAAISESSCKELDDNFSKVVNEGRKPGLLLSLEGKAVALKTAGLDLLSAMQDLAETLDTHTQDQRYSKALQAQIAKFEDSVLTPSAQMLTHMREQSLSWLDFAQQQAQAHKEYFAGLHLSDEAEQAAKVAESFAKADEIKRSDDCSFEQYLAAYNQD